MKLKIKKTHPDAVTPTRGYPNDAGLDLTVVSIVKDINKRTVVYDTGIAVDPPKGYYCEVVPRSSTAKLSISLANGTGIIDPSYRGSIRLAIRFHDTDTHLHLPSDYIGKRLCQLLIKPLHIVDIEEVMCLDDTTRGDGAYGSTGQ